MDVPQSKVEKFLVCIGTGPSSAGLMSSAKAMATGRRTKFYAIHVEDPKVLGMEESARRRAADNLRQAEQQGAETYILSGRNIAESVIEFAGKHGVSKIAVGKPGRPLWKSIFSASPVDQLLRMARGIDVFVMEGRPGETVEPAYVPRPKETHLSDYATGFLFLILATILCFLMFPYFQVSNLIMVYLVAVMLTAAECGRRPAAVVSLLSVLAFDFFFVPPRFTLTVEDAQFIVTFAVMFLVALVIGHLAARMRQQAQIARLQERQANAMYGLSRRLAGAGESEGVLRTAVQYLAQIFDCGVVAMMPDDKGTLKIASGDAASVLQKDILEELDLAQAAYETGRMTGWGIEPSSKAEILCVPLQAAHSRLGVLVLKPSDADRFLLDEQRLLLEWLAKQIAAGLEMERLTSSGMGPCL